MRYVHPKQGVPNNGMYYNVLYLYVSRRNVCILRIRKWLHISDVFTETKYIDFCIGISQIIERKYDACYYIDLDKICELNMTFRIYPYNPNAVEKGLHFRGIGAVGLNV